LLTIGTNIIVPVLLVASACGCGVSLASVGRAMCLMQRAGNCVIGIASDDIAPHPSAWAN
jgi:hypothetical protein